jgi:cyclomaltodextrinase / maltogenic alpha-amylase / neopullulanase
MTALLRLLIALLTLAAWSEVAPAAPAWLDRTVIYGVALPLVAPPAFDNVRQHLGIIAAAGADSIWLSPVTEAAPGDYGYAITDHFRLRAAFGNDSDLHALIRAAHARGMHVFVDMVVNHLSDQHRFYIDAVRSGKASAYYDWFDRDAAGTVTHYFDWVRLENLNYGNPDVRAYITAAFVQWVRDFQVDGFRIDAAWAIQQRAPDFWPQLSKELRRINPELVLIAEASARDPRYAADGFDAAYDWTNRLGEWAWQRPFEPERTPRLAELREALLVTESSRGHARVLRFLNNNDTGPRFLSRHGPQETRSAIVLLFTLPGLPLIYQGDEQGAQYQPYKAPRPIPWHGPITFGALYAQLAQLRRAQPALRSHDLQIIPSSAADSVLEFVRPGACPADSILVLLNFASLPRGASVPGDIETSCRDDANRRRHCDLQDLLTGRMIRVAPHDPQIELHPHESLVLRNSAHRCEADPGAH